MKRIVRWGIAPLCIVALLIGSFVFQKDENVAQAAWYNSNWDYRARITIDKDAVSRASTTVLFAATTTGTSWTVPSGITSVTVHMWGGGGGGGAGGSAVVGGTGGGAGYMQGKITVTPGESLTVMVGGGGAGGTFVSGASAVGRGGGGGGYSAVKRSSNILVLAPGGGGGGGGDNTAGSAGGAGGPGGGSSGVAGSDGAAGVITGGGAGTQSSGGGAGSGGGTPTAGSSLTGGNGGNLGTTISGGTNGGGTGGGGDSSTGRGGGGGGGAGYYGGGGGGAPTAGTQSGAGGGGGSSFASSTVSATSTSAGSVRDAGNNVQAYYTGSAGQGGTSGATSGAGGAGSSGLVVIAYTVATLADFPVFVDMADLPDHVWNNMRSDCGDIRVTTSDETTEVPREIVACDTGTQTGEFHFKAPSLTYTTDTAFYIYYGNAAEADYADTATYGAEKVWTNGYLGVWHLGENGNTTAGGYIDSTSKRNHGTGTSMTASSDVVGQVGYSQDFDGSADRVTVPRSTKLEPTTELTLSAWVRPDGAQASWAKPVFYGDNTGAAPNGPYGFELNNTSDTDIRYKISSAATSTHVVGAAAVADGVWSFLTGTYDGSVQRLYRDATSLGIRVQAMTLGDYGTYGLGIGDKSETGQPWGGPVDEVRIASSSRSASWIGTEYNNQLLPTSFYTIGDATLTYTFFVVGGTTWSVPADWNDNNNTIEVIGGGGSGAYDAGAGGRGGGGGGAYSKVTNADLPAGSSVGIQVGDGGTASGSGTDTYLCNSTSNCGSIGGSAVVVGAKAGTGGGSSQSGVAGGSAASGVGDVKYSGGNGGNGNGWGGGGGGGAAGPNGSGKNGGSSSSGEQGGGGGGGAGGGAATSGSGASGSSGGAGGKNYLGASGGAAGVAGTNGAGGGGGNCCNGATGKAGGNGIEWDATHGAGGGGGAGVDNTSPNRPGAGGLYGGGGGGAGDDGNNSTSYTGAGGQGIVVITYTVEGTESNPTDPTFTTPPYNVSSTSIRMTATSTDLGQSVESQEGALLEFYFRSTGCDTDSGTGGTDSGWIATSTYTDSGLEANKCYGYRVTARDGFGNTSGTSTASSTYTSAVTPGAPTFSSQTVSGGALEIDHNGGANPTEDPATLFAVVVDASSPVDSTWEDKYIDANGNPSTTAVWLSDAAWDEMLVYGLAPGTSYTFKSKARNEDGEETPFGTGSSNSATLNAIPRDVRLRGGATLRGGTTVR